MNTLQDRVITLIDMDCFYVQVEQRLTPEWKGKPCAVVQYNDWKGGGIIAVGYEARARGVSRRSMRGDDAKTVCPEIHLFKVPESRGKADLTRYREAGAEVITVLSEFSPHVERASIDEAYIDLTHAVDKMLEDDVKVTSEELKSTHIVGAEPSDDPHEAVQLFLSNINTYSPEDRQNMRLLYGACIVEKMRAAVKEKTGFSCSAGISHNKVLSKLACGINKPNKQTLLSIPNLGDLYASMPLYKVRHLGGKLGKSLSENFHCNTMGDVSNISEKDLRDAYGEKTGMFLYNLSRGLDTELVKSRQLPQSVGCSKNFRGKLAIDNYKKARHWLEQLSSELEERLIKDRDDNSRISRSMTLSVRFSDWQSVSRACTLSRYSKQNIEKNVFNALSKLVGTIEPFNPTITCLGLSSGKFSEINSQSLSSFMVPQARIQESSTIANDQRDQREVNSEGDTSSTSIHSLPGDFLSMNSKPTRKRTLDSFLDKNTPKDQFAELESQNSTAVQQKGRIQNFLNRNADFDPFSEITEKRFFDDCDVPKHRKVKPTLKHFFRSPILSDSGETTDNLQEEDILQSELLG